MNQEAEKPDEQPQGNGTIETDKLSLHRPSISNQNPQRPPDDLLLNALNKGFQQRLSLADLTPMPSNSHSNLNSRPISRKLTSITPSPRPSIANVSQSRISSNRRRRHTVSNVKFKQTQSAKRVTVALQLKDDQDQLSDDGQSYSFESSNSDVSLDSEDKTRLTALLGRLFGLSNMTEERDKLDELLSAKEQNEIDDKPDYVEGIFFIKYKGLKQICCCKKTKKKHPLKICVYDRSSLYIFGYKTWLRKKIVALTESIHFERAVISLIVLASLTMILQDYEDKDNLQIRNQTLDYISSVLVVIFTVECCLKIISQGAVMHKNSFFRDPWNWIDFAVVVTGIMELSQIPGIDLRSLRALRVLRPLRSLKALPQMRKLIQGMIDSLPSLLNAVVFMVFVFLNFAIFGTQQFGGAYYYRCRITPEPLEDGSWPYDETDVRLCSEDPETGRQCPSAQVCGVHEDSLVNMEVIDYGFTMFNNLFESMVTIFQCITLEGWTKIMYNLMDQQQYTFIAPMFFICLVILGSLFLLNVVLAIFENALDKSEGIQEAKNNEKKIKIAKSVKRAQNRLKDHARDNFLAKIARVMQESSNVQEETLPAINKSKTAGDAALDKQTTKVKISHHFKIQKPQTLMPATAQTLQDDLSLGQTAPNALNTNENILLQETVINNDLQQERSISKVPLDTPREGQPNQTQSLSEMMSHEISGMQEEFKSEQNNVEEEAFGDKQIEDDIPDPDRREVPIKVKTLFMKKFIEMPKRTHHNKCYFYSYLIAQHPIFNLALSLLIILNCIVLMIDRYPISAKEVEILEQINLVAFVAFFLEMIIKLVGYGFKEYCRDRFNIFDATIVCISTIELILELAMPGEMNGGALTAFRAIRVLRVFKLSRKWKAFNIILSKIIASIKDILTFSFLMLIFILVFIILGMQFFAFTVYIDDDNRLTTQELGSPPQQNFNNVYESFVTVFAVIIGEDWNVIAYNYMRYNFGLAVFYFITLILVTNIILLNLFLALLLQNFSQPLNQAEEEDQDLQGIVRFRRKLRNKWKQIQLKLQKAQNSVCGRCFKVKLIEESQVDRASSEEEEVNRLHEMEELRYQEQLDKTNLMVVQLMEQKNKKFLKVEDIQNKKTVEEQQDLNKVAMSIANITRNDLNSMKKQHSNLPLLEGKSLCCFGPRNRFRILLARMVSLKHYDNFFLVIIFLSTINLSLISPLHDPNSVMSQVIEYIDYVMTLLFTIEALTKIIVFGLLINGKQSYLRVMWNIIDLLVVVTSIGSIFIPEREDSGYSFFKVLRVIRFLRPLRLIKQNQRLKIAVQSLINALPGIFNLGIICVACLSILAALGVNLFKGVFYQCSMDNIPVQAQPLIKDYWQCQDYGGEWLNPDDSFDNLFQAFKTQFVIMCTEGWLEIYIMARDSTRSYYEMPQAMSRPESILYFVLSLLLTALFILNMFVGVVISTFNIEREKLCHNTALTNLESEYIDTCTLCYQAKPIIEYKPTGCKIKDRMHRLATRKVFDYFIFGCIIVNSIVLMLQWYNQPEQVSQVLEWINQALTVIFTIEFVIKLIGFTLDYFKSMWNLLDLFVCVMSWVDFGLGVILQMQLNSAVKIVRTFRVVRVLKLVRRFKELQRILMTFIDAIPALINVGGLLFLFIYLYSVIGVYFFSTVKLQSALNENANFQTFGTAMLTLFRVSTGEGWNDIMEDCARERSLQFQCYEQTFEQRQAEGIQGCGSRIFAYFYFMSFMIFVTFILLNLFIAIILEGFQKQLTEEAQAIQPETIEEFVQIWKQFDPTASGMIEIDSLEVLVTKIVQKELQIIKSSNVEPENVMFNFHYSRLLKLYTAWLSNTDDGSAQYSYLRKSTFMQRQLQRNMNKFLGDLYIPTYNKVTHYYFHDVLISFVKYFFSHRFKRNFYQRQQRIQNLKETGQELALFDKIVPDSKEYRLLSLRDRQIFEELNSELFNDVVKSIETKGEREEKPIQRLTVMKQLRSKISKKNEQVLDQFTKELVINSSLVIGAKSIQKFLLLKKQTLQDRKVVLMDRRKAVFISKKNQQVIYNQNASLSPISRKLVEEPPLRRGKLWTRKNHFALDMELRQENDFMKRMKIQMSTGSSSSQILDEIMRQDSFKSDKELDDDAAPTKMITQIKEFQNQFGLGEPLKKLQQPFVKPLSRVYMPSAGACQSSSSSQNSKGLSPPRFEESKSMQREDIHENILTQSEQQARQTPPNDLMMIVTGRSNHIDMFATERDEETKKMTTELPSSICNESLMQRAPQQILVQSLQKSSASHSDEEFDIVFENDTHPRPETAVHLKNLNQETEVNIRTENDSHSRPEKAVFPKFSEDPELKMNQEFISMLGDIEDSAYKPLPVNKILSVQQAYNRSASAFPESRKKIGMQNNTEPFTNYPRASETTRQMPSVASTIIPRPITQQQQTGGIRQLDSDKRGRNWIQESSWDALSKGSLQKTGIIFRLNAMQGGITRVVPVAQDSHTDFGSSMI